MIKVVQSNSDDPMLFNVTVQEAGSETSSSGHYVK